MAELRVSAADAYVESGSGAPTLLASAADAYVESGSGAPTLLASAVDAFLEFRAPPETMVSGVYAYVEFVPPTEPTIARPPLARFEARRAYLSIVYQKFPGEATWTMLEQGRAFLPQYEAEERGYKRIGDATVYRVFVSRPAPNVGLELYVEDDLAEIGRLLGHIRPPVGWEGTETIDLDPQAAADYKIENYDGISLDARLTFVEYVNRFWPARLTMALEAENGARVAAVEGFADSYYIVPEATA